MSTTDYAIEALRLTQRHNFRTVLDDVTLRVPAGAVVGLVGRNGAGKSSLLRCLVGLEEPEGGSALLLGCPALALDDAVRRRLGYVAQTPDLFDWMNVLQHIRLIGRAYPRWNEERALALAVRLDLPLHGRVAELSGGDQQKLAVLLALAHEPDLLLLDEPVASLDPLTRREFMRALFAAPNRDDAEPRTVVISSHILSDLERVVSHLAFLRDGRLQLFDAWDALLEHLRLLPDDAAAPPSAAIVSRNPVARRLLIDSRRAPAWAGAGRAMTLDELFAELNA